MKKAIFEDDSLNELKEWMTIDIKIAKKIISLIQDIQKEPFTGLGKPEPLKYKYQGCWSRRITDEHRLIYKVLDNSISIIFPNSHYE